jgi:hypothetical protein
MIWFVSKTRMITVGKIPKFLDKFCELLQRVFFVCFEEELKKRNKTTPSKPGKEPLPRAGKLSSPEGNVISSDIPTIIDCKKCGFCDRCMDCQAVFTKDTDKAKLKKDIDSKLDALNYLFFVILTVVLFVTQLAIWCSFV